MRCSSAARGQAGAPAAIAAPSYGSRPGLGSPLGSWSPGKTWSAAGNGAVPVSFGEPEPVEAAPLPNIPGVPADPDPAHWGNYGQPAPAPVALPAVEYSLVGPPRGIIQPTAPNEYRAVVANPEAVPDNDSWLTQAIDLNRADGLAPSGVFGAVTLPTGHFIASYSYLQNTFDHTLVGSQQVSTASVLANYPYAPTRGLFDAQVVTLSYGVTDDLTITGSLPFQHNQIDYAQTGGTSLRTAFTNPGDIRLSMLVCAAALRGAPMARQPGTELPGRHAGDAAAVAESHVPELCPPMPCEPAPARMICCQA